MRKESGEVYRIAGHIGAEIQHISLHDLDERPTERAFILDALDRHRVLFFRKQALDNNSHCRLGRAFGPLTAAHPHDDSPADSQLPLHTIDIRADQAKYGSEYRQQLRRRQASPVTGWHTDLTSTVNPPSLSILRAEKVPSFGGDTQWTNLVLAYTELSPDVRRLVDGLRAVHRFRTLPMRPGARATTGGNAVQHITEHPVVTIHPRTGERVLFVNPSFTSHVCDMSVMESRAVLDLLFAHLTRPEFTVRWRWEPGDVAIWDNRATAHLAPTDLDHVEVERRMHRVTVAGSVPVGVSGNQSVGISGAPLDTCG